MSDCSTCKHWEVSWTQDYIGRCRQGRGIVMDSDGCKDHEPNYQRRKGEFGRRKEDVQKLERA
jgi:hypothetical protein